MEYWLCSLYKVTADNNDFQMSLRYIGNAFVEPWEFSFATFEKQRNI